MKSTYFPTIIAILLLVVVVVQNSLLYSKNSRKELENKTENKALETIFQRKSVREYTAQKVTAEQLAILVRAGMSAPTAMNKQPWAFVIVDDRSVLDSLAVVLPYAKMLSRANAAIVVCGDTDKALLNVEQAYWVQDCSAASQNILLAAEAIGLGAVWTGVFPREDRVEPVKRILSLPKNIIPLNVIPVGYPKQQDSPKNKYKKSNIHYNNWGSKNVL